MSASIMLHLYTHTLYSTLLSFFYRCYVLNYRTPSMNKLKLIILLIYLPSFAQMVQHSARPIQEVNTLKAITSAPPLFNRLLFLIQSCSRCYLASP
ncbi:unnamed protein product [Strongylus vulgaris]|uniref:Uncharacterized protein n=1 Tax=Strongylus vulgaris TaxID=40348 RepID=A0A3P7J6F9_STRVU|nr:unnamed protein product [Strongylus vulgaris]